MNPRVSIVIATWNSAKTLAHCLDSIVDQRVDNWEVLVADGGSTDGTQAIIKNYGTRIAYSHSHPDKGIYDAWNQALEHARGEYACFLGSDDAFHSPDTLGALFEAIGGNDYDLVTGRGCLVMPDKRPHVFGGPWDYHKVARRITVCHPGALHRRDLFKRFGKFDTSYRICADYDFLLRLPADLRTLHVDCVVADIADGGISRYRRWPTLHERYRAQVNCPRIGRVRAAFNFADKLWRIPIAKALGVPN
jgi:glycosyltransferase involved in cell wall biosynthesis